MLELRRSADRGHFDFGWLETRHTFSFGEYSDRRFMGFRALRVINDDRIAGGGGFPRHPHRDMEIVTWVLAGALTHEDSMGNGSVLRPGDLQRMTAGRGVVHSERNASPTEPLRLLQIWLLPATQGLAPGYEERHFGDAELSGRLRLVASPDGADGSARIHQDVRLFVARLAPGERAAHTLAPGRCAWLQLAKGSVRLTCGDGATVDLDVGDGAALAEERALAVECTSDAELLLFDLA
ncbi:MAG: pirin family protein [Myxococcales bacterium]|nr:pirin family protein [Myxococcales bacterium]